MRYSCSMAGGRGVVVGGEVRRSKGRDHRKGLPERRICWGTRHGLAGLLALLGKPARRAWCTTQRAFGTLAARTHVLGALQRVLGALRSSERTLIVGKGGSRPGSSGVPPLVSGSVAKPMYMPRPWLRRCSSTPETLQRSGCTAGR